MIAVIRPAARADITRQFRYYLVGQEAPEVAVRFLSAAEETISDTVRHPGIGTPATLPRIPGLRSRRVSGFTDIRVYYVADEESVRIIRVLHGRRDLRRILSREDLDAD